VNYLSVNRLMAAGALFCRLHPSDVPAQ